MKLIVQPYKTIQGIWEFDHEHNDTVGEGLLNGTEKVIDAYYYCLTKEAPTPGNQMQFTLDTEPFPEAVTFLTLQETDEVGSVYTDKMTGMTVWLCPWLQGYFGEVPRTIFIQPNTI
jgi:hypothetical protein